VELDEKTDSWKGICLTWYYDPADADKDFDFPDNIQIRWEPDKQLK